jgi:hypothetical protein
MSIKSFNDLLEILVIKDSLEADDNVPDGRPFFISLINISISISIFKITLVFKSYR